MRLHIAERAVHVHAYVGVLICMCLQTPVKDEYSRTRQQMTAHIDVCMGGRVAEELIFGAEQVCTLVSSQQLLAPPLVPGYWTEVKTLWQPAISNFFTDWGHGTQRQDRQQARRACAHEMHRTCPTEFFRLAHTFGRCALTRKC